MKTSTERRAGIITIGDTIRGEDLETPTDVDVFTFQGQEGNELIAYIRSLAPDSRAPIAMELIGTGAILLAVAAGDTVTDLEAHPTGRFTLPATRQYAVRIGIESNPWGGSGVVAQYPRGFEFQVRPIVRTPETTSGTIVPGDTVSVEAIDYVGDIDEFTIAAPNGGEFNLFLERFGSGPGGLTVTVLDLSTQPAAAAHPPAAPLHATATGLSSLLAILSLFFGSRQRRQFAL